MEVARGELVAIVGANGAGKSTLALALAGAMRPTAGRVVIEGADVRQYQLKSLRDQISFVLQDTLLFRTTIWQNIAYGKPGASREEIARAGGVELAHASVLGLSEHVTIPRPRLRTRVGAEHDMPQRNSSYPTPGRPEPRER